MNSPAESLRQVLIEATYLRKLKFVSPKVPDIFATDFNVDILLNIRSTHKEIDAEHTEVTLAVAIKGVSSADTIFQLEVQQSGVFKVTGYSPDERLEINGKVCPEILFPFARNTITDAASKGGFPDVVLKPVDFATFYARSLRERATADA